MRSVSGSWRLQSAEAVGPVLRLHIRTARLRGIRRVDMQRNRDAPERIFDLRPVPEPMIYPGSMAAAPTLKSIRQTARQRIDFAIAQDAFSGSLILAAPDGSPLIAIVHGWADREAGRAMTMDTPINLGSIDKSFTAC